MPALPLELCLEVLERSHFGSTNHFPDYKTLRNLSLVCRAFGYHAQKALFQTVVLTRRRQALSFVQATDPIEERGRLLVKSVRNLTVKLEYSEEKPTNITGRVFVTVFLRCPNLVEITLRSITPMSDNPFSENEMRTLYMFAPRTLRTIRSQDTASGYWLMKCCPWVTGLSLGDDLESIMLRERKPQLHTNKLVEIQWFGCMDLLFRLVGFDEDDDEDEDDGVSNNKCLSSVEILGLRRLSPGIDLGTCVLIVLGRDLRSLRLPSCSSDYAECIRKHVRNLEEFILDELPSEEMLDALPPTIQHLQIRTPNTQICPVALDMRPLQHWIPTARNLKVLTWVVGACDGHGFYQDIEAACKKVGAQLHLYVRPFGTFPGEQEELASGPVKSFPRPLAFSPARRNGEVISYNAEQFVSKVGGVTPRNSFLHPATSKKHAKGNHPRKPSPLGHSAASTTETSLDKLSHTFVPETSSSAFTFSAPQNYLARPPDSSVSSTAPSTFKFSFRKI
ncbi:hypothetical protein FRC03_008344 [Tulasnella sp. 419]|nr:hypothetical protein FRC03_008344 [Tulasnella sp. 419]